MRKSLGRVLRSTAGGAAMQQKRQKILNKNVITIKLKVHSISPLGSR